MPTIVTRAFQGQQTVSLPAGATPTSARVDGTAATYTFAGSTVTLTSALSHGASVEVVYTDPTGSSGGTGTPGSGGIPSNVKFFELKTGDVSFTTAGYVDVGVSVSITPSSATSRLQLIANINVNSTDAYGLDVGIFRNGTLIARRLVAMAGSQARQCVTVVHLDTPGLTSGVTYSVRVAGNGSSTTTVQGGAVASSLLAMEVAA